MAALKIDLGIGDGARQQGLIKTVDFLEFWLKNTGGTDGVHLCYPMELSGSICDVLQSLRCIFKNGVTGTLSLPEVDGREIIDTGYK